MLCQQHSQTHASNTREQQEATLKSSNTLASNTKEPHAQDRMCAQGPKRAREPLSPRYLLRALSAAGGWSSRTNAHVLLPPRPCTVSCHAHLPSAKPSPVTLFSTSPVTLSSLFPQALSLCPLWPSKPFGVRQTPSLYNTTSFYMFECPLHDAVSIFCACACACAGDRDGQVWGEGGREKRPGNVALGTQIPRVLLHARLQVDLTQQSHPSPRHQTFNGPRKSRATGHSSCATTARGQEGKKEERKRGKAHHLPPVLHAMLAPTLHLYSRPGVLLPLRLLVLMCKEDPLHALLLTLPVFFI